MLSAAGVPHEVRPARVDEQAATEALRAEGASARSIAVRLAELKARQVSAGSPGRVVVGADTVAELEDGTLLGKPQTRAGLSAQLAAIRGRRHRILSATVAARDGDVLFRHVGVAVMDVRPFSEAFAARYVAEAPEDVLQSVGGYHVEGRGIQLFSGIRGDLFTVRGLPLLPLLAWLREAGELAA